MYLSYKDNDTEILGAKVFFFKTVKVQYKWKLEQQYQSKKIDFEEKTLRKNNFIKQWSKQKQFFRKL